MNRGQEYEPPWHLAAAAVLAVAALFIAPLIGLEISGDLANGGGQATWLTLLVGVFVVAAPLWWLLVSRPRRYSAIRGAVTGILVAFLSYPVVAALSEIVHRDWQQAPPLIERAESVLVVTGLTLMTTGFAATASFALLGALIAVALASHPAIRANQGPTAPWSRGRQIAATAASAVAVALLLALLGSFVWLDRAPVEGTQLSNDDPELIRAASYDDAIAAFRTIEAEEAKLPLHELCGTQLATHGQKVARAVIYFHGFTSCPAQGDRLAETLFAMGYNVYRPRLFGHGQAKPDPDAMAGLTAQHMIDLANQSVDIAKGLGDEVVVIGLSAGGTMAAWTAQFRADVAQVIAVSPFFGPYIVPRWANGAATNLTLRLPDMIFAWNPLQNLAEPGDFPTAMPSTHALAEIIRVGMLVHDAAAKGPPAARHVGFVLNEADVAVNNALTEELVELWQGHGAEVRVESLPFSRRLPHDIINHRERGGDVDLVHSIIITMMNAPS